MILSTSLSGYRNGQWIQMAGVQSRPDVLYVNVVGGGSEPPSDTFLLNDPTIRYTIFATAVPETSQYTLLLVSMPLLLFSVLRRRQVRTAPTFTGTATRERMGCKEMLKNTVPGIFQLTASRCAPWINSLRH